MEEIWEFIQGNLVLAQECQSTQANHHHCEVDFGSGDSIWLILHNYPTDHHNKKLASQQAGPFCILEWVGHAY